MARILITGCGGPAAHNFVDAVRQDTKQHTFIGVDANPYMKHLSNCATVEDGVLVESPNYFSRIEELILKHNIDFIHPQPDVEVLKFSADPSTYDTQNRHDKLFLPHAYDVQICQNKYDTNKRLECKNIPVPKSWYLNNLNTLQAVLTLEPRVWLRASKGAGSKAALPIKNMEQAKGWLNYWLFKNGLKLSDFMVSEFLPGKEYAWQSLWYEGKLISSQARERVEYLAANLMPSGQSSSPSVARTVSRKDVYETGEAAVLAITDKPHGVFCIDMKENKNKIPCVTEINAGRFFTTSNFFAHAGLNMPAMYLDLALTGKTNRNTEQLPDDLYWMRQVDMGYKLVDGSKWE
jgi:hypothetical protein